MPSKTTRKTAKKGSAGFTAAEREAMKERAREMKSESRGASKASGEADLRAKIAAMKGADRAIAIRLHAIVTEAAPELAPKTWYGMPAYAKDGKVVCFFQSAAKFKSRYATVGFSDQATLDDGAMWPTTYAVKELTPAVEAKLRKLVKAAVKG